MANKKTPSDVSKMIKDHDVKLVDFKFTDLPGTWQHFTTTLTEYNDDIFTEGLGFDGSSIRGWKVINASDMLVIPDPTTAWIDIFNAEPTLSLICTIVDPITREPYDRDPRGVAEKAEAYLKSTGIADTAFFGPEAEFFIFDDVRFSYSGNTSFAMSHEGTTRRSPSCPSRSSPITVPACTRTSPFGKTANRYSQETVMRA